MTPRRSNPLARNLLAAFLGVVGLGVGLLPYLSLLHASGPVAWKQITTFDQLLEGNARLSYRNMRASLGAVDWEKGIKAEAIVGANFGPMSAMIKGEMPWDDAQFKSFADDLAATSKLNFERGFPSANQPGKTRARPAIWENQDDFSAKLNDFRAAAAKLADAAAGNDKKAILEQFKATGGTCKACHDEYKSKDYL